MTNINQIQDERSKLFYAIAKKVWETRFAKRRNDRDDMIQEAVIKMWKYDRDDREDGYFYKVAYNTMLNYKRCNSKFIETLSLDAQAPEDGEMLEFHDIIPSTAPTPEELHDAKYIHNFIDLQKPQRKKIMRLAVDGSTQEEIAQKIGVGQPTINYHIEQFRADLSNYIKEVQVI